MIIVFIKARVVGPYSVSVVTVLTLVNRYRVTKAMILGVTLLALHGTVIPPIYAVVFIEDMAGGTAHASKKPVSLDGRFFCVAGKTLPAQKIVHKIGRGLYRGWGRRQSIQDFMG
jgi:hypothetical protein